MTEQLHQFQTLIDDGNTFLCVLIGVVSIFEMQLVEQETRPGVLWQKIALALLCLSAVGNALLYFPEYELIVGHRPSGVVMNAMVFLNVLVMAVRGLFPAKKTASDSRE